ncbi:MAG: glycine--tRNA ligase subunit beta [Rhodobacterales bacterium]|nr:MAG: glycine--tRNA ligase subunit beta [Rhodobacterales bacterium]
MPDLLIELFSEEIPARMQARAADDLKRLVTDGLVEAGLTYAAAGAFATPRRLALSVEGLLAASPDTREERKGPKVGAPDKAVEGFLRGAGVAREDLEVRDTGKGEVYFAVIEKKGRPAQEIVAEVLEAAIRNFPWPKSMRWGSGSLRWVRPLHSILCILADEAGAQTVPLNIDGIEAGATTRGHRFMAPEPFEVTSFDAYESHLARAHVVLRSERRAETIRSEAENLAFAQGLELVPDDGLLAEVAGLVEWPVPLMGEIGAEFLELPPEVLQTSMKEHQKFFSLRDPKSGQITRFVTVANVETADQGATILKGNQKVLAARLADAKFFWTNDLRVANAGMAPWAQSLTNVTFHNKLGSQAARIDRIAALARELAPQIGADPDQAEQAAKLAKLDLASEMVYEFPELQGVMGRYYAKAAGYPDAVADAARDHYAPLGPSDDVPSAAVSVAVALADKLDTLTGFWAIDEKPTGSKDPFALRRAALGVIRLVLGNGLRLRLDRFIDAQLVRHKIALNPDDSALPDLLEEIAAHGVFGAALRTVAERLGQDGSEAAQKVPDISDDLLSFLHDRLKVHLRSEGVRHDVIDACLAMPGNDDLALLVRRAEALGGFLATEDGGNLVQGFKRANNILTQAEEKDGVEYSYGADLKFAETDEERALFAALDQAEGQIKPAMEAEDFAAVMQALAALRAPIDAFFEAVQVNTDSDLVRRNRLNLLSQIRSLCLQVADLGRIEG